MKKYLSEGVVAGAAGGLAMALFLLLVGEGAIGEAIARESQSGAHEEMFTRGTQQLGGAIGVVFYGALLGALLGITLAVVRHRLSGDDWARSARVTAVAFVSVVLVPFVKYPPSPPGVGDPATVGRRTALYLLLVAVSVATSWAAWRAYRLLAARGVADQTAVPLVLGAHLVAVGLAIVLLPPTGDDIALPVDLVWRFRLQSLAGSALLFAVAGLVLGARLRRQEAPHASLTGGSRTEAEALA